MTTTPLISRLSDIASGYDALICDVWGVLHDGVTTFASAHETLLRFKKERGPVTLLSNSPRLPERLKEQLDGFKVPRGAYDAAVTSGGAARTRLEREVAAKPGLKLFHMGPERDVPTYEGLNVRLTRAAKEADVFLCTGLFRDEDVPDESYRVLLEEFLAHGVTMVCANPDMVVQKGDVLNYCAGAVAKLYEELGGKADYYGKPYRPVYDEAMKALGSPKRVLAIGDGIPTDIKGANDYGIDAVFIGGGIHSGDLGADLKNGESAGDFLAKAGVRAVAAMTALAW